MHRLRPRAARVASFVVFAALATGCFERSLGALTPCTRARVGESIDIETVEDVDLLFVIDDSGSMREEQGELIAQVPRLVQILASGDSGLDGTIDFHPARSIHVGIVSTDMGSLGATGIATCAPGGGDEGVLRSAPATCSRAARGPVFDFERGGDAASFATDVGCAANLGTMGCGEEQPLESMLEALSPSTPQIWTIPGYAPPTFLFGTGHGGDADANAGLVRGDSVLAIILISDENDSSARDPNLFSLEDPRFAADNLNTRGLDFPDALQPVERYVQGLLALRQLPSHLVFGAIVGVPVDAEGLTYDQMLALPEMQETTDPARPDRFLPACRGPLQTDGAYPGRRAIEVARGLAAAGAGATVGSICDSSFEAALDRIIGAVGDAFRGTCLPRPLGTDADGRVPCEVQEVLAPIGSAPDERTHCAALATPGAYTLDTMETLQVNGALVTREVCRIHQLGRSDIGTTTPGWFYDDGSTGTDVATFCPPSGGGSQRVSTQGITLVSGAELRFLCDEHIEGTGAEVSIGSFCNPGVAVDTCAAGLAPDHRTPLVCDLFTRACAVPCGNDSACTAAGLPGQQCDTRTASEVFGAAMPSGLDPMATHDTCVNAICQ